MVYDCFLFFNELDLLEIRLNTLDAVVDRFVIGEATHTHQGKKKPLFFEENKERFKPFLNKIEHLVYRPDEEHLKEHWLIENNHRRSLSKVMDWAHEEDIILLSDLDEIPKPEVIREFRPEGELPSTLLHHNFWYYLNFLQVKTNAALWYTEKSLRKMFRKILKPNPYPWWPGTVIGRYEQIANWDFEDLRKHREDSTHSKIKDAGWHFSYLGGIDKIVQKLESYAHSEYNKPAFKEPAYIKNRIQAGGDLFGGRRKFKVLEKEDMLPDYLLENKAAYAHLFFEGKV